MAKRYCVTCSVIYYGSKDVEADSELDALNKVQSELDHAFSSGDFPHECHIGSILFNLDEASVDCAYKANENDE